MGVQRPCHARGMILMLLACASEPTAPVAEESPSAMRDALRGIQSGETPDATPTDREPPVVPDEARREESEPAPSEDPAECREAKARRAALEERIHAARAMAIDPTEDRLSAAQAEMQACIYNPECANDGNRVADLSRRLEAGESSYDAGFDQVAELEAGLFAIDQDIRAACGHPRR